MVSSWLSAKLNQLSGIPPKQVLPSEEATYQSSWLAQITSDFIDGCFRQFNNCYANTMHVLKGGNEAYKLRWNKACVVARSTVSTIAPTSFIPLLKLN